MTATQGLCSDRFCLLVPAYTGATPRAAGGRARVRLWRRRPAAYGKGTRSIRRQADGCNRGVGPRWMAWQAAPDWSAARSRVPQKGRIPASVPLRGCSTSLLLPARA